MDGILTLDCFGLQQS